MHAGPYQRLMRIRSRPDAIRVAAAAFAVLGLWIVLRLWRLKRAQLYPTDTRLLRQRAARGSLVGETNSSWGQYLRPGYGVRHRLRVAAIAMILG